MSQFDNKKNIEDFYPLSPMQQGMLFHSLYAPDSGVYVEQLSCTLRGNLHVSAFESAWQRVADRHSILRTSFVGKGLKEPIQVVHRQVRLPLVRHDWRRLPPHEQEARLEAFLDDERSRGFDHTKAPLMRLALMQLGKDAYQFVWTYHHILLDGWSIPMLLQEVFAFYEALSNAHDLQLPPSRAYRDYIIWLKKQKLGDAENFWKKTLKGFRAPTSLVMNKVVVNERLHESGSDQQETFLSAATTTTLQTLARQHQLTLNTLMQGVWALLLSRYSGEEDVLFGATVSGRPAELAGAESMLGLFINTLPVRVRVSPGADLLRWLKALQAQQVELRQYEYSPLVQVQAWSEVPHGLPLFESILVFENFPVSSFAGEQQGALRIENLRTQEQTNFPMTIVGGPSRELLLRILYDRSRFGEATIRRLMGHFRNMFERIAENPNQRLSALQLLTAPERQQILAVWNDTATSYPDNQCIHELFEAQVERTPNAIALWFDNVRLTYRELNSRANQLAHFLRKMGVGPEVLVGICVERSVEMVIGILGVLKAGGAYMPIDPTYPRERLAFMLEDAAAPVLLTQKLLSELLPAGSADILCLDSDWEKIAPESSNNPINQTTARNLAYVIYTSGSTGKPKGVLLEHRGLCNLVQAQLKAFAITSESRVLQFASSSFDASVSEVFTALLSGAVLSMARQETLLSPTDLVRMLQNQGITTVTLPPSLITILPDTHLPELQTLASAGESCSREIAVRWSSGRRFLNAYGPSENTVCATCYQVEKIPETSTISIGRPIDNVQIYLLSRQGGMHPVPVGVPGELYIGGVGLARGYLNRPDLTAEKFIPNPFSSTPGERLYKTGDLSRYLDDGNIEFLGRIDQQVKVRGFRIELEEIEAVLSQHATVQDVVVIVREDSPGDQRIIAYVVSRPGTTPANEELSNFLKQKLPAFMLPSACVFLEAFPLSPNGKVDRKALPAPSDARPDLDSTYIAPRDALELRLSQIWEDILQKRPIGVKDNFFALGGHSLLAMRLLAQIEQQFRRDIPLVSFFQEPTITHLAGLFRQNDKAASSSILIELQKGGSEKPPLFFVHPTGGSVHWYADLARYLGPDQPFYGLQAKGTDGNEELDTQIETMASRYVAAIMTKQPVGPYYIGGWSFGVIVAFEVAQQIFSLGHEVAFLAILDQGPLIPIVQEPSDNAELLAHIFASYFTLDVDYLRQLELDEQFKFVLRKAKKAKLFPFYIRLQDFRQYVLMNKTQTQAWRKYIAKPYPGKITLFRAEEHDETDSVDEPDLGWERFAKAGIEIIKVTGNHISMMQEPYVKVLAQRLRTSLDAVKISD